MSVSTNWTKLSLIIIIISISFSNEVAGQSGSAYEKGEVALSNSSTEKGLLWLVSPGTGTSILYFKTTNNAVPKKYSPDEVISFSLDKSAREYISIEFPGENETVKEFIELLIVGEVDLLSYQNGTERIFYLRDSSGMLTALKNSYQAPSINNNYRIQYGKEYLEILPSILGSEPRLMGNIRKAEFNAKDLSDIVAQYHKIYKHSYTQYPPPMLSGVFIGAGSAYSSISHISPINETFVSSSPFLNFSLIGGVSMFRERVDISLNVTYSYGIISHDDNIETPGNITTFYEDISKVSLLSNGIIFSIKPVKFGRLTPFISAGADYNIYLTYSRDVTEELLFNDSNIMVSNSSDDFQKPGGFLGIIGQAGLYVDISQSSAIKLNFNYNKYIGAEDDCQSAQGLSISYLKNIF